MSAGLEKQFRGAAARLLPWVLDAEVTDLLINGLHSAYVQKKGRLECIEPPFSAQEELTDFVDRLVIPLGKRLDAARPYLDGRLADGSRFHLIYPPIAPTGPLISIRKHAGLGAIALESFGPAACWVARAFAQRKNILLCGGTGSGKTTLLNLLLETVPVQERVVVVEEAAEIRVAHPHTVFLEARQAGPEGVGEVPLSTLIKNALRMRPDRLVLGECRGAEAWDLIQALNTGHPGSACTLHANGAREGLRRLETLLLLSLPGASLDAVREWVACAVQAVVFLEKRGPTPQIAQILEVRGLESQTYRIHPIELPGLAKMAVL
ncbi:Flp pilus assembly complex ATPase component TadA [bacterium]|nr:Flp pilus assembly complex ATPase component TadA [bacterium]